MNCREFSSIVIELARGQAAERMIEISSAQDALTHAENCDACAALLAEQRRLSQQLGNYRRASTSEAVSLAASLRIETSLLAAFRERRRHSDDLAASPSESLGWKPWAIAIAAMLLITLAGIAALQKTSIWLTPPPPLSVATETPAQPAPLTGNPIPSPRADAPVIQKQVQIARSTELNRKTAQENVPTVRTSPSAAVVAMATDGIEEQSQVDSGLSDTDSAFLPLLYGGDPMLAGSGPVVRVEMSGAVLQSLGFPIAGEPSARRVKADLMLGEDGVARAIRFVE